MKPSAAEGRPGKEQREDDEAEVEGGRTGREREDHGGADRLAAAASLQAHREGREPRLPGRREAAASGFPGSEPLRQPPPARSARRLKRGGKIGGKL